jgi:hypothetical protein
VNENSIIRVKSESVNEIRSMYGCLIKVGGYIIDCSLSNGTEIKYNGSRIFEYGAEEYFSINHLILKSKDELSISLDKINGVVILRIVVTGDNPIISEYYENN